MNNSIQLNISHIAVLKKSQTDSSLYIDYIEIDKPVSEKTDYLLEQLKQDDIPDEKLISLLKTNLDELKSKESINFCADISDSYQGIYLEERAIKIIENLNDSIGSSRKQYIKDIVKKFLLNKKNGKTFNQSLKKVKATNPIMYSHRYYGWHCEPYTIDSNFKVRIESNFGYGWVSYFFTILNFKGIDIVPFSRFIEYKNARVHEIIRFSKEHFLIDEEWKQSFEYIKEATSCYKINQELFIQKYIIDECENLVNGLEWFANESIFNFKEDKVIRNKKDSSIIKFETKSIQEKYNGRPLKLIRAEKITGALSLINSITKLMHLFDISSIVKRIEKLNHNIEPMLYAEKNKITLEIRHAEEEHEILSKKLEEIKRRFEPRFQEYNRLKINSLKLEIITFLKRYPNFGNKEVEYNELKKAVFTAASYINQLKKEKDQIEGFIKNQKNYFLN